MPIERDPWIHPNLKSQSNEPAHMMAMERDPSIQSNLKDQSNEPGPMDESTLIIQANRSIALGLFGLLLPFLLYLYGSLLTLLPQGFPWPRTIPGAPLIVLIVPIYGAISAKRVMRDTTHKSLAYNRAFWGLLLNGLLLLIPAAILLLGILIVLFAIGAAPGWK